MASQGPLDGRVGVVGGRAPSNQKVLERVIPSGLEDSYGRLIDGNDDGQPGSNAVAILTGKAATISARTPGSVVVDLLLVRGELAGWSKRH